MLKAVGEKTELQKSRLDPRTKLLLLFTLPTFLLSGAGGDYFRPIRLILSVLPFVLLLSAGNRKKAGLGFLLLLSFNLLWFYAAPNLGPGAYILLMIMHGFAVRLIPCLLLGAYVLSQTTVSEFIGGMERLHVPSVITIPLSVIFRFFPTVLEETHSINQAMSMRGIRIGGTQIHKIAEYRLVPSMICSLRIGDELSAAALSRGLGSPRKRSSICRLSMAWADYLIIAFCFLIFLLWALSFFAGVYLW